MMRFIDKEKAWNKFILEDFKEKIVLFSSNLTITPTVPSNEWQKQALIYKTWIIEAHPFS